MQIESSMISGFNGIAYSILSFSSLIILLIIKWLLVMSS